MNVSAKRQRQEFMAPNLLGVAALVTGSITALSGSCGTTLQGMAIVLLYPLLPAVVLVTAVILPCLFMAWLLRLHSGELPPE